MNIGIDGTSLTSPTTGVRRYLENLLLQFCSLAPQNTYTIYVDSDLLLSFQSHGQLNIRKVPSIDCPGARFWWRQIILPYHISKDKLDIFFSPNYFAPLFLKIPTVVAIHDISFCVIKKEFKFIKALSYNLTTKLSAHKSSAIITCSVFSKNEIIKHYKISSGKIFMVPLASDQKFKPIKDKEIIKKTMHNYNIDKPFFLYVGSIFQRRNIPVLLKAFKKVRDSNIDVQLLLVGKNMSVPNIDIRKFIEEYGLSQDVIWVQHIPDEEMPSIYCGAEALLHLSSYEGFGIPVIEAIASGIPVIASRIGPFLEIGKDVLLFVDSSSVEDISKSMISVFTDRSLRERLIEKGLERANAFSWQKTAIKTLNIFKKFAVTQ